MLIDYLYNPHVREATLDDAEALEALEQELFPDNCFGIQTLKSELMHGDGWVLERDGEIVAYALIRTDGHLTDLTRLGVLDKHRRQGYATILLFKAMTRASKTMLTVRRDNTAALSLYKRWGFHIVGRLENSWVMLLATSDGK